MNAWISMRWPAIKPKPNTLHWNPLFISFSTTSRMPLPFSIRQRLAPSQSVHRPHHTYPKWTNLLILTGFWQWFNWIEATPIEPKINFENQMDLNGQNRLNPTIEPIQMIMNSCVIDKADATADRRLLEIMGHRQCLFILLFTTAENVSVSVGMIV